MRQVTEKILDICKKYSHLPAVKIKDITLNYQQLYSQAAQLANCIKAKANDSKNIGILSNRSKTTYIGTLSCLLAGYTFVPLNKNFPPERLSNMIKTANIDVIIVDNVCSTSIREISEEITSKITFIFPESQVFIEHICKEVITMDDLILFPSVVNKPENSLEDIAYILFTSGSTGLPKGVPITHNNLASFVETNQEIYNINCLDRLSQTFEHTFDLALFDMMMSWCHGACLYAMQAIDLLSPSYFVRENQITVWFSVPSLISLARKKNILKPDSMPSLRLSLFCGEALTVQNIQAWQAAAPQSIMENLYGPTELTIACARYRWENDSLQNESFNDIVPLGKIYKNHSMVILDENHQVSLEGELFISGQQMFKGYWQDDEKTNAAFITIERNNYYKTGDKVKVSPTGNLLYLGRNDHQVKINGYRVELGDIECCIKKYPNIIDAVAISFSEENNDFSEIAVFVTSDVTHDENDIITFAREKLPRYMIPKTVKLVESMPLNNNGKIDRNELRLLLTEQKFSPIGIVTCNIETRCMA